MARTSSKPLNALLGPGATYEGDLSFEGRVRIDGVFRGRVFTDSVLEVGRGGLLEGDVDAHTLVVAGRVVGRVRARTLLVVESTGAIEGTVRASSLEVHPGASLSAEVHTGTYA